MEMELAVASLSVSLGSSPGTRAKSVSPLLRSFEIAPICEMWRGPEPNQGSENSQLKERSV